MTRFLIIIPAFNEEAALPRVLRSLEAHTSPSNILVIDDGSSDRTADVARSAGVAVASLPFNLGIGGALRTGFRYAIQQGYERAIQFDADGQHDVNGIAPAGVARSRGRHGDRQPIRRLVEEVPGGIHPASSDAVRPVGGQGALRAGVH